MDAASKYKFCMQCGSDMKLKRDHESRDRLTCSSPTCGFIFYNNPIPVVAAIVEHWSSKDRKDVDPSNIVLARGIGWPAEAFGLVTGFLEAGEEPSTGCLREVKEELGLDAELVELVGVYDFARMNQIIIAYHVYAYGAITLDKTELEAYRLTPISRLRPWPFATGHAVKDFLLKRSKEIIARSKL